MSRTVGRPRDEHIDEDILDAAARILTKKGYTGLTMDAVAMEAKVSKHSLYLRYQSPAEITVALLHDLASTTVTLADTGSFENDLTALLRDIRRLFLDTPFGVVIPALIGAGGGNPELVKHARAYLQTRRSTMEILVMRAIKRGELLATVCARDVIDACLAPVYYRHLISGAPLTDEFIVSTVRQTLKSLEQS